VSDSHQILARRIRAILKDIGQLKAEMDSLADDSDLYAAGLTSQVTVNLMLALEDEFGVEFPDELLRRSTFSSVEAIRGALTGLGVS